MRPKGANNVDIYSTLSEGKSFFALPALMAIGTIALQSFFFTFQFIKCTRKLPVFRLFAKSGFDRIVFDIFYDIYKMFSILPVLSKFLNYSENSTAIAAVASGTLALQSLFSLFPPVSE